MKDSRKKTGSQSRRFIEKARELGCDEDEAAFEQRLRKIAKATPFQDGKPKAIKPKRAK
jgi:hypothetical protein